MKKIAVVLSGCGFMDGSEIYESVLTLLALDRVEVSVQCFAPNINQTKVVNHLTGQPVSEQRNVLIESARLARGQIKDVKEASSDDFDALIFPGGFGAAVNLTNFVEAGAQCKIDQDVLRFAKAMATSNKPLGFMCISPVMIPLIYGKKVKLTIGNDKETADTLNSMGAEHVNCSVVDCYVDKTYKVVTTPAYMLAKSISELEQGICRLVDEVLKLCHK